MMEFKVKNIQISTGDLLVAILNEDDASKLDLHKMDRIKISYDHQAITAIIDIAKKTIVSPGQIGLFEETTKKLKIKQNQKVRIDIEKKPESIGIIRRKLEGHNLEYEDFKKIMFDIISGNLTSIEITYFVAGCYTKGLSDKETIYLTQAMINTGEKLHFPEKIIMDKHCIGGIAANRTTPIVVAIIAAAGYIIPKTSSRSITSAAGTADTIEYLCDVNMSAEKLKEVVKKTNGCLAWGGALNLAPADDKIIHVESPISLDPTGQLIASVLAKKASVSANHVLIDIPVGRGAKIENKKAAKILKKKFKKVGRRLGMKIKVVITDGTHPIGNGVGPMLEARDILWTLRNDLMGSWELKEKSIYMAGQLLRMAGHFTGESKARKIFDSGDAYKKFMEIVKAQGGKEIDPDTMITAKYTFDIISPKTGKIMHIDNKVINKVARIAGAPLDTKAGLYLYTTVGKEVNAGTKLYTIYSENKERLEYAVEIAKKTSGVEIE